MTTDTAAASGRIRQTISTTTTTTTAVVRLYCIDSLLVRLYVLPGNRVCVHPSPTLAPQRGRMGGKDSTGASLGAKYSPPVKDDVKTLPAKWSDMTMASRSRPPGGSQEAGPPSAGLSREVKMMLLVFLCLQNAIYTMLRRYRCGILARSWGRSEAGSTEEDPPPPPLRAPIF